MLHAGCENHSSPSYFADHILIYDNISVSYFYLKSTDALYTILIFQKFCHDRTSYSWTIENDIFFLLILKEIHNPFSGIIWYEYQREAIIFDGECATLFCFQRITIVVLRTGKIRAAKRGNKYPSRFVLICAVFSCRRKP